MTIQPHSFAIALVNGKRDSRFPLGYPESPMTAFEARVAAEEFPAWTSVAEEAIYLEALAASTPNLQYESIGESVQGKPIWLVRVRHGTPPSAANAQGGPTVLIVTSQHGNEGGPREAAFKFMRDLASANGSVSEYLTGVTWLFIPTPNPDRAGQDRLNAAGVDLNRDHMALSQPETRAIHAAVRDYRPEVIVDGHEATNSSTDVEYAEPMNLAASGSLITLSVSMINDFLKPALTANGWTYDKYSTARDENRFRNMCGLRHAVAMLTETKRTNTPNQVPRSLRFSQQLVAMNAALDFDMTNRVAVNIAVVASRADKMQEGALGVTPFNARTATLDPPPLGYQLTSAQVTATAVHRDLFGIGIDVSDIVEMGQEAQPLIPLVLDSVAGYNVVSATRLYDLGE